MERFRSHTGCTTQGYPEPGISVSRRGMTDVGMAGLNENRWSEAWMAAGAEGSPVS